MGWVDVEEKGGWVDAEPKTAKSGWVDVTPIWMDVKKVLDKTGVTPLLQKVGEIPQDIKTGVQDVKEGYNVISQRPSEYLKAIPSYINRVGYDVAKIPVDLLTNITGFGANVITRGILLSNPNADPDIVDKVASGITEEIVKLGGLADRLPDSQVSNVLNTILATPFMIPLETYHSLVDELPYSDKAKARMKVLGDVVLAKGGVKKVGDILKSNKTYIGSEEVTPSKSAGFIKQPEPIKTGVTAEPIKPEAKQEPNIVEIKPDPSGMFTHKNNKYKGTTSNGSVVITDSPEMTKKVMEHIEENMGNPTEPTIIRLYRGDMQDSLGEHPNIARLQSMDEAVGVDTGKIYDLIKKRMQQDKELLAKQKQDKVSEDKIIQTEWRIRSDEELLNKYKKTQEEKTDIERIAKENSDLVFLTENPMQASLYAMQRENLPEILVGKKPEGYSPRVSIVDIAPNKVIDMGEFSDKNGQMNLDNIINFLDSIGITDRALQEQITGRTSYDEMVGKPASVFQLFRGYNLPIIRKALGSRGYDAVKMFEGGERNWIVLDRSILKTQEALNQMLEKGGKKPTVAQEAQPIPKTIEAQTGQGDLLAGKPVESNETGLLDVLKSQEGAVTINPQKTKGIWHKIKDSITIDVLPKLSRENKALADAGVQHASAKIAIPHIVRDMLSSVFPQSYKNPEVMSKTIDILNKDNILGGYDEFRGRAEVALRRGDVANYQKWADAADDIALKHDINGYNKEILSAKNNKEIMSNVARWKGIVNPALDKLYNEVKRVDPSTPREGRGRHFDAHINLVTKTAEEMQNKWLKDETSPQPEPSYTNYQNPNVKPDPFDQMAKFTGDYSTDANAVLTNVLSGRYNEATKIRLFNELIKSGSAVELKQGQARSLEGYTQLKVKLPKTFEDGHTSMVERNLLVKKELAPEIRRVLNTDMSLKSNPVMRGLTNIQLLQIADLVTHSKNLLSVVTSAQGAGSVWKDIKRKMPVLGSGDAIARIVAVTREIAADTPAIRAEIAQMAKEGNIRPSFPPTGIQKVTHGQQFLHSVDTSSRIIMNRFFDNLAERGLVQNTPTARRNFINQVGQYNTRLMGPVMRVARDLGVAPFIVAGRNFNRQGRRILFGSPGVETTPTGKFKMRAINLTGVAALFTLPMILNTLTTGSPGGRSGTPLGAWDLGYPEDEKFKHKTIDLLQLTGVRRGMRSIGFESLIEGVRQGKDLNQIVGSAFEQAGQSVLHPWLGPGIGGITKGLTGKQLDLRGSFQATKIPEGGISQTFENMRAMLESQNPLIYSIIRPVFQEMGIDTNPDEPYASGVAKTFLKSPAGAFGVKDVPQGRTAAEELAQQYSMKQAEGLSAEQKAHYKTLEDVKFAYKNGDITPLKKAVEGGDLTINQAVDLVKNSEQTYLQKKFHNLTAEEAIKVVAKATPEEKQQISAVFIDKIVNHIIDLKPDKQEQFITKAVELLTK